ncbi:MAG: hypothetical protein REI64_10700 [Pedobacter sp.]|uniref:hypothetical protein n=1 Tax=Pedobacter sp. TaxID=1411316 RepID=UPI00280972ED|nr:hypothetical protein [Pedobacter sp.]MDQ8005259.1 hypothetical protein [Pedobacter sp.]
MKNLKSLMFGLVALVMVFGLVFTVSAFKAKSVKKTTIFWRYNPNDASDLRNEEAYSIVANPGAASCDPGTDLPCVLEVDASIDDETKLHDYLNDMILFPNDADITASTSYKKLSD